MSSFWGQTSSPLARDAYPRLDGEDGPANPENGFVLGPYNTYTLRQAPRSIGFLLARHKFVAKMLEGCGNVLEVGCQEGLGTMMVAPSVGRIVAVDFYKAHIESCVSRLSEALPSVEFRGHDILDGPIPEAFDAAYSMDVIEHIDPSQESAFMRHISSSLAERGTFIVGTPSLESQRYASPVSKQGHINCKSGEELRTLCRTYFHNVFMFGMNDEVVHTGFLPMAHYLIALCIGPKPLPS